VQGKHLRRTVQRGPGRLTSAAAPRHTSSPGYRAKAFFLAATVLLAGVGFVATADAASGISAVGSYASAHNTGITTLAVSPAQVGDVLVLSVRVSSGTITATSVAGGGATTWTRLTQHTDSTDVVDDELWMGPVTTTGSSTISVTFSASVKSDLVELVAQEFSAGLGASTTWAQDTANSQNNASSTKVAFPSLTPASSAELYVGYGYVANSGTSGSTAGVTYDILPTTANFFVYDTSVSGALAPSATQSPAGTSSTVGVLLSASSATPPPPPPLPTVTGLTPNSGPTVGGTSVVITGTNLSGALSAKFGTNAATGLTKNTATSLTVTAPAGASTVDVTVTTAGGTSLTNTGDEYTYNVSTSPTITAVGSYTSAHSTGVTTLGVTPAHVGDVLVLAARASSGTTTVSSVTGGGVSSWTKLTQHTDSTDVVDDELWMGPVATTGSSTISVTFSASVTSTLVELVAQEFSSGLGTSTVWAAGGSGAQNNTSSTKVAFPSLTPTGSAELYVGYGYVANSGTSGSTAGVTYDILPTTANFFVYDTSVSGALAPSATQSPAGTSSTVGALLSASTSSVPPPPPPPPGSLPTVTGLSPTTGPVSGGTTVVITGANLSGATAVAFGVNGATGITANTATSVTVTAPAGSSTVDVTVTTGGGTSATSPADQYTYTATAVTWAGEIPLGVYPPEGGGDPAGIASYAAATGTDPTLALDFLDKSDGWAAMDSASVLEPWTGSGYRLVVAVPIIPTNSSGTAQGTLAAGATGAYNQYFTTLGQNLVKLGLSNAILRIGWEFNGNWYAWSVATATDAANYVSYWQQIVTTMRAVPGEQFKFFWNPNGPSPTSYTPAQAYPGNSYVDYVGTDVYDNSWVTPFTPAVGWSNQLNQQWGLDWLASFAAQNDKPIAIAEWSDEFRTDGHGFGDDPTFIDNMAEWFIENNVAFTDNFCYDSSSTYRNDLLDGTFPNALAEFELDFG